MAISGSLAGLAGAIMYLVPGTNLDTSFYILPGGFDGISVALLGLGEPLGALFAGLFLAHIRQGGFFMQINGFVPQIIDMIIAAIVYVTAISTGIQIYLQHLKKKRQEKKAEVTEND